MIASYVTAALVWTTLVASFVSAQFSGWTANQVNATLCTWDGLRAAALNGTVYIDGGEIQWIQGMADGTLSNAQDENEDALVYTLNFNTSFSLDSSFNYTTLLSGFSKAQGGTGDGSAPNYYSGGMLANDYSFFLYGGYLHITDTSDAPYGTDVTFYEASQYGPYKEHWNAGFDTARLEGNMTRYVAYGGAVNAPSENMAWYFSGQRANNSGPIYQPLGEDTDPSQGSDTLIALDMGLQTDPQFTNKSLPDNIQARGGPSVVWVPTGEKGILVAIGGVTYPGYADLTSHSANEGQSRKESPGFMTTIDIYDVAGDTWYQQPTGSSEKPGQLTLGCAVVGAAEDYSSFNIYYFGGYDGLDDTDPNTYSDDIWVLSLPSFYWFKLASGDGSRIRYGHQCFSPYPDQMMVLAGLYPLAHGTPDCLKGVIQMINMTDGSWMSSYDPNVYSETYNVPSMVYNFIGGDETGGATMDSPQPSGWANDDLATLFQTKYDTSKIVQHWPYQSSTSDNDPERSDAPTSSSNGGLPSWAAPVLGVVLGLVFVTAIVVAILLYRRRNLLKRRGTTDAGTDDNGNFVMNWIRGQTSDKAPTVTSDELPPHHHEEIDSEPTVWRSEQTASPNLSELPHTPLVELMDTSPRELDDTGMSHVDIINKHTHFSPMRHSSLSPATPTNPSTLSQPGTGYTASVSQDHRSTNTPPIGGDVAPINRAMSPELEDTSVRPAEKNETTAAAVEQQQQEPKQPQRSDIVSGVSAISERAQAHLRQMSDGTVSTASHMDSRVGSPTPPPQGFAGDDGFADSRGYSPSPPLSPPSVHESESMDYVSLQHSGGGFSSSGGVQQQQHQHTLTTVHSQSSLNVNQQGAQGSPLRRTSVFSENRTDMGEADQNRQ